MTQRDTVTPSWAASCSTNAETGHRSGGGPETESESVPDTLPARGLGGTPRWRGPADDWRCVSGTQWRSEDWRGQI